MLNEPIWQNDQVTDIITVNFLYTYLYHGYLPTGEWFCSYFLCLLALSRFYMQHLSLSLTLPPCNFFFCLITIASINIDILFNHELTLMIRELTLMVGK